MPEKTGASISPFFSGTYVPPSFASLTRPPTRSAFQGINSLRSIPPPATFIGGNFAFSLIFHNKTVKYTPIEVGKPSNRLAFHFLSYPPTFPELTTPLPYTPLVYLHISNYRFIYFNIAIFLKKPNTKCRFFKGKIRYIVHRGKDRAP